MIKEVLEPIRIISTEEGLSESQTKRPMRLDTCGEIMAFKISLTRSIKAEREFVFDWWTDLSPSDSNLVKPLKKRTILSKTPEMILLHDEEEMYLKRMAFEVKVTLGRPERWIAEYDGKDAWARSEYLLQSQRDGTTLLSYNSRIEPKGRFTKIFSPVVKPFVRHVFVAEMKTFIQALEADYRKHLERGEGSL